MDLYFVYMRVYLFLYYDNNYIIILLVFFFIMYFFISIWKYSLLFGCKGLFCYGLKFINKCAFHVFILIS